VAGQFEQLKIFDHFTSLPIWLLSGVLPWYLWFSISLLTSASAAISGPLITTYLVILILNYISLSLARSIAKYMNGPVHVIWLYAFFGCLLVMVGSFIGLSVTTLLIGLLIQVLAMISIKTSSKDVLHALVFPGVMLLVAVSTMPLTSAIALPALLDYVSFFLVGLFAQKITHLVKLQHMPISERYHDSANQLIPLNAEKIKDTHPVSTCIKNCLPLVILTGTAWLYGVSMLVIVIANLMAITLFTYMDKKYEFFYYFAPFSIPASAFMSISYSASVTTAMAPTLLFSYASIIIFSVISYRLAQWARSSSKNQIKDYFFYPPLAILIGIGAYSAGLPLTAVISGTYLQILFAIMPVEMTNRVQDILAALLFPTVLLVVTACSTSLLTALSWPYLFSYITAFILVYAPMQIIGLISQQIKQLKSEKKLLFETTNDQETKQLSALQRFGLCAIYLLPALAMLGFGYLAGYHFMACSLATCLSAIFALKHQVPSGVIPDEVFSAQLINPIVMPVTIIVSMSLSGGLSSAFTAPLLITYITIILLNLLSYKLCQQLNKLSYLTYLFTNMLIALGLWHIGFSPLPLIGAAIFQLWNWLNDYEWFSYISLYQFDFYSARALCLPILMIAWTASTISWSAAFSLPALLNYLAFAILSITCDGLVYAVIDKDSKQNPDLKANLPTFVRFFLTFLPTCTVSCFAYLANLPLLIILTTAALTSFIRMYEHIAKDYMIFLFSALVMPILTMIFITVQSTFLTATTVPLLITYGAMWIAEILIELIIFKMKWSQITHLVFLTMIVLAAWWYTGLPLIILSTCAMVQLSLYQSLQQLYHIQNKHEDFMTYWPKKLLIPSLMCITLAYYIMFPLLAIKVSWLLLTLIQLAVLLNQKKLIYYVIAPIAIPTAILLNVSLIAIDIHLLISCTTIFLVTTICNYLINQLMTQIDKSNKQLIGHYTYQNDEEDRQSKINDDQKRLYALGTYLLLVINIQLQSAIIILSWPVSVPISILVTAAMTQAAFGIQLEYHLQARNTHQIIMLRTIFSVPLFMLIMHSFLTSIYTALSLPALLSYTTFFIFGISSEQISRYCTYVIEYFQAKYHLTSGQYNKTSLTQTLYHYTQHASHTFSLLMMGIFGLATGVHPMVFVLTASLYLTQIWFVYHQSPDPTEKPLTPVQDNQHEIAPPQTPINTSCLGHHTPRTSERLGYSPHL
jgi:hypothetical protein